MDNIGVTFGIIEGYELSIVNDSRIKKTTLFDEIKKQDEKIISECKDVLSKSGKIYAYEKNGKIKAIYLFEEDKEKHILNNIKTLYVDELVSETILKFDARLKDELKEYLLTLQYKKVYLNEEVIQIDPRKNKDEIYLSIICGALIGFVLGLVIGNDLIYGFIFASIGSFAFSGLDVVVSKKRGRKKK